jgi:undecaprenyl-diphosphatase
MRLVTAPAGRCAFLAAVTLSLTSFLVLAALAAQHQWFDLDHSVRQLIRLTRHPMLDGPMQGFSLLGEELGLIPLIALTSATLWAGRRPWALALPLIMTGTGALQLLAKWAVDRPRPNLAAWGFPSGHVLTLVVFFGVLAYLLCTARSGWGWRSLGAGVGGLTVLVVAFSRLYLDVHWLSDVAGGFALGLAYLLFSIWLVESISRRRAP